MVRCLKQAFAVLDLRYSSNIPKLSGYIAYILRCEFFPLIAAEKIFHLDKKKIIPLQSDAFTVSSLRKILSLRILTPHFFPGDSIIELNQLSSFTYFTLIVK